MNTPNSAEQLSEKLNDFADAYHDWRDWIEHGYGNYYDQVFKEKQATYERLRGELLAAATPPAAAPAPAVPQGWVKAADRVPLESDGEVFVRFTDGSIGTGWATYWHGASNEFAQWTFPDPDEDRTVLEWTKNPAAPAQEPVTLTDKLDLLDVKVSAGLCQMTADGKHAYLREIQAIIAALRAKEGRA